MVAWCVCGTRTTRGLDGFISHTHTETDSFAFDGNEWVLGCHSVSFFGVHTQTHKDTHKAWRQAVRMAISSARNANKDNKEAA